MIGYNFNITRSSYLRHLPIKTLFLIFLIFFIDFYELSLQIGYAVYLNPILMPNTRIADYALHISELLLFSQFIKIFGLLFGYYHSDNKIIMKTPFIGQVLIFGLLVLFFNYHQVFTHPLYIFVVLRIFSTFFFGMLIAYAIQLTNHIGHHFKDKIPLYSFIMLSCELGMFVAIFVNRFLISRGISFDYFEQSLVIQQSTMMILLYICYLLQANEFNVFYGMKFRRAQLCLIAHKYYKHIILRMSLISYSVLLIVLLIRTPNSLHLYWGFPISQVNHMVALVTLMGFIGSFLMLYLQKIISPFRIIMWLYAYSFVVNIIMLLENRIFQIEFHSFWLYNLGFLYGAFLRITPLITYNSRDFTRRIQVLCRLLSYLLSYMFIGSLSLVLLDYSYHLYKIVYPVTMVVILLLVALIGLVSLLKYGKYKN